MQVSKNFHVRELVPFEIYLKYGDSSIWFVDKQMIEIIQAVRERYGIVTINNKYAGGQYNYSGFRPPDCKVGAKLSQHRFYKAYDCKFKNATPKEVYEDILSNQSRWLDKGLTTMEDISKTPTWLHLDGRWTGMDKIKIVKP